MFIDSIEPLQSINDILEEDTTNSKYKLSKKRTGINVNSTQQTGKKTERIRLWILAIWLFFNCQLKRSSKLGMDINSLFSKHLIASSTTKDNFKRELIDCIYKQDIQRFRKFTPYLNNPLNRSTQKWWICACRCHDSLPNSTQTRFNRGPSSGLLCTAKLGMSVISPNKNKQFVEKAEGCKPCTEIGKNVRIINCRLQYKMLNSFVKPNQLT